MILTFDVGGTFIKWGLVDDNKIIQKGKVPTPQDTFENFLDAIQSVLSQFERETLEGLAFSLPGTMDKSAGLIHIGGALRYNDHRYFVKEVSEKFRLAVTMENDANAAALAEIEFGHLKDSKNGLVIVVGTGIGGAFVHDGEILRGSHGYGGEISIMPIGNVFEEGVGCIFGEQAGMRPFIAKVQKELNDSTLTGESFMELVSQGHQEACRLLSDYMKVFTQAIFTLQIVYDPDHIVIGGGISANETYMAYLKNHVETFYQSLPLKVNYASIDACTFHNDSNLMGALVSYYRQRGM